MIPKNKYLSWQDRKKKINRSVERKRKRERDKNWDTHLEAKQCRQRGREIEKE